MRKLDSTLLTGLSVALLAGCGMEGTAPEGVASISSPILNGTPVTTEDIGVVKIMSPNGGGCSGTILAPSWIITAQHCVSNDPTADRVYRTSTGEVKAGLRYYRHPNPVWLVDVALLELAEPFDVPVDERGYTNPLWPGEIADLVGKTVSCYGYGIIAEGGPWGTLTTAELTVAAVESIGYEYRMDANAQGQIQMAGDSGSGCYYTSNGKRYQISVMSGSGISGTQRYSSSTAAAYARPWVELQLVPRCDDGLQSGHEEGVDCGGPCAPCPPTAEVVMTSQWNTGYCADVVITNYKGDTTHSWQVVIDTTYSALYSQWNAEFTMDGSIMTARNLAWNGQLDTRQSTRFGFCAEKTGMGWWPDVLSATLN